MNIAINAVRVSRQGGGGIDHYIINLVNRLAKLGADFDLYTLSPEHFKDVNPGRIIRPFAFGRKTVQGTIPVAGNIIERGSSLRSRFAGLFGDWVKMFWIQVIFPFHLIFKKYDIMFSPSQIDALPFTPSGTRQVISVLDLIPFILKDQKHKHMFFLKTVFPAALKNAAHIITISANTKKDVMAFFRVPVDKITPVLLAKPEFEGQTLGNASARDIESVKRKYGLDKYILCVSGNHPHKNIARLIDAYDLIKDKAGCSLAISGYQDKNQQAVLDSALKAKNLSGNIKFLGHTPSRDLPSLYCGAEIFVFPSLYEGFGLPPLEALSYGVPVALSKSSSLPEVAGDAGVYFDPYDTADIAQKIAMLLSDENLKKDLRKKGPIQAAKFSWEKTAQETLNVFKMVADRK